MNELTLDRLTIDYTEEQLSFCDVQELLHESTHLSVLLQRVPLGLPWERLGAELGWEVSVQPSQTDASTCEVHLHWVKCQNI